MQIALNVLLYLFPPALHFFLLPFLPFFLSTPPCFSSLSSILFHFENYSKYYISILQLSLQSSAKMSHGLRGGEGILEYEAGLYMVTSVRECAGQLPYWKFKDQKWLNTTSLLLLSGFRSSNIYQILHYKQQGW